MTRAEVVLVARYALWAFAGTLAFLVGLFSVCGLRL